jgi:hypothetical protein
LLFDTFIKIFWEIYYLRRSRIIIDSIEGNQMQLSNL